VHSTPGKKKFKEDAAAMSTKTHSQPVLNDNAKDWNESTPAKKNLDFMDTPIRNSVSKMSGLSLQSNHKPIYVTPNLEEAGKNYETDLNEEADKNEEVDKIK
jgi:hypothetical protein